MGDPDPSVWSELIRSSPAAVAVIVIVFWFLKHIREADDRAANRSDANAKECHATQNRGTEALIANAAAAEKLTAAVQANTAAIQEMRMEVAKCQRPGGGN